MNGGSVLTIRAAVREDAARIIQFNISMARESEGIDLPVERITRGVQGIFDDPSRGRYWLCESGGIVAGQLMITYEWSDWRAANFWWIQSVYTDPAFRRRGVYGALHRHVLSEARRQGACGVRLYVEHHNKSARAVYAHLGMAEAPYGMMEIDFVVRRTDAHRG